MLRYYVGKMRKMTWGEILDRGVWRIRNKVRQRRQAWRDKRRSTYGEADTECIVSVSYENLATCRVSGDLLGAVRLHLQHRFDLLGSGWVHQCFGMECRGMGEDCYDNSIPVKTDAEGEWLRRFLPPMCLPYAKLAWQQISEGYAPIDWQLDFKSGYRWSAQTWYGDIAYGHTPGADIKVPWELSRMQHLPQMAIAFSQAKPGEKKRYVTEFQDEVLDFIAQNPPRFGVCWACTMDVGIRVANWLMAYDLFVSLGANVDEMFLRFFSRSVRDHAVHIINNLEYSPRLTTNHYLSDIAGLLFAAVHLPASYETDAWLAFALQELIAEMKKEFHEDGSNFEGSVSYHCLSTEIMLHCALLVQHLSGERRDRMKAYRSEWIKGTPSLRPLYRQEYSLEEREIFPHWFWERLERALRFVKDCSAAGNIQQIGDVDSGRFFKLSPVYQVLSGREAAYRYPHLSLQGDEYGEDFYDEDLQNHEHLTEILNLIQQRDDAKKERSIEKELAWQGWPTFRKIEAETLPVAPAAWREESLEDARRRLQELIPRDYSEQRYSFGKRHELAEDAKSLLDDLEYGCYPGMGIYVWRSRRLHLIARCGEVGQNGNGGHCHNDQLEVVLALDGEAVIQDIGSYLYTPSPEMRNLFRSTKVHFTPQDSVCEQNEWFAGSDGLFSIKEERTKAHVLYHGADGIIMRHDGFSSPVWRVVQLTQDAVVVRDYGKSLVRWEQPKLWSNGYGKLRRK